jgi:NarL family two-component system response regulator LiaR
MSLQPARVLIVDDNEMLRAGLAIFFETLDDMVMVGEASNGQEAIELCSRLQPDIIIMDLLMPVMDGVTATRLIRERHPQVKVLVLTSSTDPSQIQAALAAGANGYFLKQTSTVEIEKALHKMMA